MTIHAECSIALPGGRCLISSYALIFEVVVWKLELELNCAEKIDVG